MADELKIEAITPDDWWPPDFETRTGEVLMEFPCLITSLQSIDGRVFAVLENGQTVCVSDLLGEAKH